MNSQTPFAPHNAQDIIVDYGFKVKAVAGIKVCAHRLGVVVDDERTVAELFKGPDAAGDARIVKFNPLPNADRARAKNKDRIGHAGIRLWH